MVILLVSGDRHNSVPEIELMTTLMRVDLLEINTMILHRQVVRGDRDHALHHSLQEQRQDGLQKSLNTFDWSILSFVLYSWHFAIIFPSVHVLSFSVHNDLASQSLDICVVIELHLIQILTE